MTDVTLIEQLTREAAADGVQQLVVGAVIERDGRVLLLRRPSADFMGGVFELPSGKVEPGESVPAALIREVVEESGLHVTEIRDFLGNFDYTSGSGKKSRQFNFVVSVVATEPIRLQEHDEFRWLPLDEEPPVTDAVQAVLRRWRELRERAA